MKPFDLEAAKQGEPIQTRDGRPAKFIAFVPEARKIEQVVVLVENSDGAAIRLCYPDGRHLAAHESTADLLMAPKKRTLWVNLYPGGVGAAYHYDSQIDADTGASPDRIGGKAWPLEIME